VWFSRFADKERIGDGELKAAAVALEDGNFDACLGGNVYKLRVPRPGGGKSRGYRIIVLFKSGEKAFFCVRVCQGAQGKYHEQRIKSVPNRG
jgi:hypothetical protein